MHWKTKAQLYRMFEVMPLGRTAYMLSQKYLTRSLPRPVARFPEYLARLELHIEGFKSQGCDLSSASYFEFGAGWDLFFPIGFAAAGMAHQHVVDLTPLAKVTFVNHVITNLAALPSSHLVRTLPTLRSLQDLREIGIHYAAPSNAAHVSMEDNSVDLISTTSVLEHVPEEELLRILMEIKRIAKPGAIMSMVIDYEDHYGQRTPHIDIYNFLQFSQTEWVKYNPPMHYQNRLRHRDYVDLFARTGFQVIDIAAHRPEDWAQRLRQILVHPEFSARYDPEELAITQGVFLLRC